LLFQPGRLYVGHSKWATIKRSKGKTDAARGKLFSRLIREVTIAARIGAETAKGTALRYSNSTARASNMPGKISTMPLQKGTGQIEGVNYEEMSLEGFAAGGIVFWLNV